MVWRRNRTGSLSLVPEMRTNINKMHIGTNFNLDVRNNGFDTKASWRTFALATLDCDEKKGRKGTMVQWPPTMYIIRKIRAFRYPLF